MIFQRINYSDPEKVFMVVYNVQGSTLTANYDCVWASGTPDGISVTQPATATLSLFAGIVNADIANSSYGAVQVYGYRSSAFVTNDTSQAITAGDILIPVNGANHLARSGASDGKSGFLYAAQSFATAQTPAAAAKGVFIRSM